MRLGLSSVAAPGADLDGLLAACGRRGLFALELDMGDDGHAATWLPDGMGTPALRDRATAVGVAISGVRTHRVRDDGGAARLAGRAGAPVLVAGGPVIAGRVGRATELRSSGAEVAVVVDGGAVPRDLERVMAAGLDLAWDADAAAGDLGGVVARILGLVGDGLRHVRILGGGPEATMHEGRGIGELMARLALAGYGGPVILAPGSTRYRVAWEGWLGRRGGWGCGSRTADPSLVRVEPSVLAAGGGP